jgi:hypothetical protein
MSRLFVDELVTATLPGIQQLADDVHRRAVREARTLDALSATLSGSSADESDSTPLSPVIIKEIWKAALSDVAVGLLWAIAARASNREFVCSRAAIEAAVDTIDREELARETGVPGDDLRFALAQMGTTLEALVGRRGTCEVSIDRQLFLLRSASGEPNRR